MITKDLKSHFKGSLTLYQEADFLDVTNNEHNQIHDEFGNVIAQPIISDPDVNKSLPLKIIFQHKKLGIDGEHFITFITQKMHYDRLQSTYNKIIKELKELEVITRDASVCKIFTEHLNFNVIEEKNKQYRLIFCFLNAQALLMLTHFAQTLEQLQNLPTIQWPYQEFFNNLYQVFVFAHDGGMAQIPQENQYHNTDCPVQKIYPNFIYTAQRMDRFTEFVQDTFFEKNNKTMYLMTPKTIPNTLSYKHPLVTQSESFVLRSHSENSDNHFSNGKPTPYTVQHGQTQCSPRPLQTRHSLTDSPSLFSSGQISEPLLPGIPFLNLGWSNTPPSSPRHTPRTPKSPSTRLPNESPRLHQSPAPYQSPPFNPHSGHANPESRAKSQPPLPQPPQNINPMFSSTPNLSKKS